MSSDLYSKLTTSQKIGWLSLITLTGFVVFFVVQVFLLILVFTILSAFNVPLEGIDDVFGETRYWPQLALGTVMSVGMLYSVYLILGAFKIKDIPQFLMLRVRPKDIARNMYESIAAYGFYFLTFLATVVFLQSFVGFINTDQAQELGIARAGSSFDLIAIFAMLVIIPAVVEEIIFRGFLFNMFKRYGGMIAAYVLTSVLFGFAHLELGNFNWIAVIDTLILSVFLIYISQKHRSLYSAMVVHAIKNSVAFYILFVR